MSLMTPGVLEQAVAAAALPAMEASILTKAAAGTRVAAALAATSIPAIAAVEALDIRATAVATIRPELSLSATCRSVLLFNDITTRDDHAIWVLNDHSSDF